MTAESELIRGIQNGGKRALREFYDRYAPVLLGICIRYCGNRHDAEDVMHDALIKIITHLQKFEVKASGSFEGWIKTIAVNTALNFLRDRSKGSTWFTDDLVEASPQIPEESDLYDELMGKISHKEVLQMICELPEGYRTVFNLFVIEGRSHKEIAEACHCSESTSKTQLFKARSWLKGRILDSVQMQSH